MPRIESEATPGRDSATYGVTASYARPSRCPVLTRHTALPELDRAGRVVAGLHGRLHHPRTRPASLKSLGSTRVN
eukprot:19524-Rhodomonas_salina.2